MGPGNTNFAGTTTSATRVVGRGAGRAGSSLGGGDGSRGAGSLSGSSGSRGTGSLGSGRGAGRLGNGGSDRGGRAGLAALTVSGTPLPGENCMGSRRAGVEMVRVYREGSDRGCAVGKGEDGDGRESDEVEEF